MSELLESHVLPFGFAKRHGVVVIPAAVSGAPTEMLYLEGLKAQILAEVRRVSDSGLTLRLVDQSTFDQHLSDAYQNDSDAAMQMIEDLGEEVDLSRLAEAIPETGDLLDQQDDAPIIKLINSLLTEAVKVGASDIHIETYETRLVVRFRVDGVLREIVSPRRALAPLLVSRIKVMAKLDIAEKRLPQDGRISVRVGGKEVDVRVSTIPASNGERVVMRLLDKQEGRRDLSHLGMSPADMDSMSTLIKRPHGILLVTGPTGSGKSTTLYAFLDQLNDRSRNILTVEDPIEYDIEGIGQTQVNVKAEMTFAKGLRAILRQDPDVVMVGEIRDLETAEIAVKAAQTGHLVLSTLHTNDAPQTLNRLVQMGIPPFNIAASVLLIMAQRLARKLCEHCKQGHELPDHILLDTGFNKEELEDLKIYDHSPTGCERCTDGYRGRIGIFQVMPISDEIRRLILNGGDTDQLAEQARAEGIKDMRESGIEKIRQGITSIAEINRITRE